MCENSSIDKTDEEKTCQVSHVQCQMSHLIFTPSSVYWTLPYITGAVYWTLLPKLKELSHSSSLMKIALATIWSGITRMDIPI